MRWHCLQHVPFESPAHLVSWVRERGHVLTATELWRDADFPAMEGFDGLFILGGPMNVYEDEKHPWLGPEKEFIGRAIEVQKPILGICLGAQLLSFVLGGSVSQLMDEEIGWLPVELTPAGRASPLFADFPNAFTAFQWHGDSFSIPPGAIHVARSDACDEQAFIYGDRVVGLQFHLETSEKGIAAMIKHCGDNLGCGESIQGHCAMTDGCAGFIPPAHRLLEGLLDKLSVRRAKRENLPLGS